jgi:hypothetical protein
MEMNFKNLSLHVGVRLYLFRIFSIIASRLLAAVWYGLRGARSGFSGIMKRLI